MTRRNASFSLPSLGLVLNLYRPGWCGLALLLVMLGFAATPAKAQTAGTWNKRGQTAELRGDYDAAYTAYLHAHQKNPKDMRYTERVDRVRFLAGASHVDRGRVLRQSGDIAGALAEFTRALQIDGGNEAAAQELRATQHPQLYITPDGAPISASPAPAAGAPGGAAGTPSLPTTASSLNDASSVLRQIGSVTGPVTLKPLSNNPITLRITADSKVVYKAIGDAVGLNILFDPDYKSKTFPVELNSVSFDDALRIVGMTAGTFYKVLTPDTIYVAENSATKHTDLDELAVQTFYLSNVTQPTDGNDVQTALRNVLGPSITSGLYYSSAQNAMVVRATPDVLLLAQKIIGDLDRPKAEVVVDVAILEVNRDKITNLGITLPQSFSITPQSSCTTASCPTSTNSNSTATNTTNTNTTVNSTNSGSTFTLNTLGNLNATNFAVTLTGGTLNAMLSDADTRVLQNPSIRETDGQHGTLKIGSRIPIATGSYSAGAATGITAGIGVQTQFQYIDVGVNIDLTPTVHLDREISLKEKIEVSSETGSQNISGVVEPIIGQRSSEGTIQLKDGEPCLLAGILEKQDNSSLSGTPGLAQIPILKYIFGSSMKETSQDEIVFVLIPHIVRESPLTRLNTRAIDTGTSKDIQIRRDSNASLDDMFTAITPAAPSSTTAARAAAAMAQQFKEQAMPPTPPPATPTPPAGAAAPETISKPAAAPTAVTPVSINVTPGDSSQSVGSTFKISVTAANAQDLYSIPLQIQFDPKVLQLVNVDAGTMLAGGDGQPVSIVHRDEGNGMVTISVSRPPGVAGVNGQGEICNMTFKAVGAGDSSIALARIGARDSKQAAMPAVGSQGVVHVK